MEHNTFMVMGKIEHVGLGSVDIKVARDGGYEYLEIITENLADGYIDTIQNSTMIIVSGYIRQDGLYAEKVVCFKLKKGEQ